jgi:hypothetical protein
MHRHGARRQKGCLVMCCVLTGGLLSVTKRDALERHGIVVIGTKGCANTGGSGVSGLGGEDYAR